MIKKIHVNKYRKIENIDFEFAKGVNVISGTNGTCKTSLLHIISNSFQAVTKKCNWIKDASCLDIIRQVNNMINPKIETLAKGDKSHNDPAIYSFWYGILNETDEFCNRIYEIPLTINEWNRQRNIYMKMDIANEVELGFATFYLNRTNISGVIKGGVIGGKQQSGKYKLDARFNKKTLINKIKNIAKYKDQIVLLNYDAKELLKTRNLRRFYKTFINIDPPYVKKGAQLYENAFTETDHKQLYELVKMCNRKWIVTYDVCPFVADLYKNYRSSYLDVTYSVKSSKKANEYIFFSDNIVLPKEIILR